MKSIPAACAEQAQMKDWEEIGELGRGSNSVVLHVRHRGTGQEAALKWIHIEYGGESGLSMQEFREAQTQLLDEINIMQKLSRTPQIVAIQDYAFSISGDGACMDACIRMELLTPLVSLLRDRSITAGQTARLVRDIVSALSACHSQGIIHGDLKPENILCSGDSFKLSDFGVSVQLQRKLYRRVRGTQYFQPPEVRKSLEPSVSSDVYSLGMTLYLLFNNGMLPFQTQLNRQDELAAWRKCCDMANVPHGRYPAPKHASPEVAEVILRATALEEQERCQSLQELEAAFSAAIAALADNQKLMPLPYFRAEDAGGAHDRVYLSTNRLTFDPNRLGGRQELADEPPHAEPTAQTGFVIPDEEKREEPQPEDDTPRIEQAELPEKRRLKLPPLLLAALVVVLLAGGIVLFALPGGGENVQLKAEPGMFSATVLAANAPEGASAQLCAAGSDAGVEVSIVDGALHLGDLAPETEYVLTVSADRKSMETRFTTLAPAQGGFRPVSQMVSTCAASLPDRLSKEELAMDKGLTELSGGVLSLRPVRLAEQNLAVLLYCSAACQAGSYSAGDMYLVLRAPDDVCVQKLSAPPVEVSDGYIWTIENFAGLFDQYYSRHHRHYEGQVSLEIYWQEALVGSAEVSVQ